MIKARHSGWFQSLFGLYLFFAFRRHFRKREVVGNPDDQGLPILAIANHMSWWDGFWMLDLNNRYFKRRFHVMMLEDQLQRNPFLARLGAFSIRKKSKTAAESIRYAANLLEHNNNLLLIFPQGKIQSQHQFPFEFEQGWGRLLMDNKKPLQILLVANLLDYGSDARPTLRQYVHSLPQTSGFSCEDIQQQYNAFYRNCLTRQKNPEV